MKCSSCKENSISRGNCCFKIYNLKEKTFYAPKTNQITSCFELYEYYINEDSFECVEKIPEEGYYLSNERTGVYSPCHHDCKTCYGNYSESNTNCILCSDENLYFLNKYNLKTYNPYLLLLMNQISINPGILMMNNLKTYEINI